jgi:hypothetical protein
MVKVQSFDGMSLVNAKAEIQHPLADEVSIAIGDGAMARFPYSVELAFFKNGDWQEYILEEFAAYHSGGVYAYVPLEMFANFLEAWRVRYA